MGLALSLMLDNSISRLYNSASALVILAGVKDFTRIRRHGFYTLNSMYSSAIE